MKKTAMKSFSRLSVCASILVFFSTQTIACTLWAVAGPEANGGTLVSKNRDWKPDHTQKLKLVRSKRGFDYFGLYAEGNDEPGLKAGINAKGLTIVSASVNLPKKALENQPGKRGVMSRIMESYASVDALSADADQVFSSARASYFVVADSRKVLVAEVGLEGKYSFRVLESGAATHTNHYLDPELAKLYNDKVGPSSATRLARINELLTSGSRPFSSAQFAEISRDQNDGPDNSLWRSGKSRTMASWIVESPVEGVPKLRVVIANPDEAETVQEFVLDEAFWKR